MQVKIIVTDKTHLQYLIAKEIELHGNICDLNHIDVSMVNDMSYMFFKSPFKGNISNWKPVNLRTNDGMFKGCSAPEPYWFLENKEHRAKAIDSHTLATQLQEKLLSKSISTKKIKI